MSESSPSDVRVDTSVRKLSEDLGIDYRSLFIDLGKATVSGLVGFSTGNPAAFGKAIGELLDAYSAFEDPSDIYDKVGHDPGKLAWLLIHQSILSAVTDLVSDHDARFLAAYQNVEELPTEEEITEDLEASVDLTLPDAQIQIRSSFFDRPTDLDILEPLQQDLKEWFVAVGVPEGEATSISSQLPAYFRKALIVEWRDHSEYQRLEEAVQGPFAHAEQRALAWEAYRAHLKKQIDKPVFGEAVSLKQIYVRLRAFQQVPTDEEPVTDHSRPGRRSVPGIKTMGGSTSSQRHVSWLRESILKWLHEDDETDDIRIIRGDPGTGKSSFSKMLAAELAGSEDHEVVFIPIHRLDATKKLTEAVRQFVSTQGHPLDGVDPFEATPLLLILDGLDEISERGHEGRGLAREFVDEIESSLGLLNQGSIEVRVLLSGRKIAADIGARVLRDPAKVFNLIPFVPKGEESDYEDPDNIAFTEYGRPVDQRDEWWQKYGEASSLGYEQGMPSRFRRGRLDKITEQPLLNHLVALAYEDEDIHFPERASPSTLYSELLSGVYRRDYDFLGPHPGTDVLSGMTQEEQEWKFIRVLEEIALDAWRGDGRTTTVESIEDRCRKENLLDYFDAIRGNLKTGISQLLTAFYFRETERGQDTFEFTHKTFAEYLTASRIVRKVEEIHNERQRNRDRGGSYGHDIEEALCIWTKACGPSAFDGDLFEFFADEIRIRHEEENCAAEWKDTFAELIRYVVRHDLPMHVLDDAIEYSIEKEWARNAEEALLAVAHACRLALLEKMEEDEREAGFHSSAFNDLPKGTTVGYRNQSLPLLERIGGADQEAGLHAINVLDDLPDGTASDWIQRLQTPFSEHKNGLYLSLVSSVVWENSDMSDLTLYRADFRGANLVGVKFVEASLWNSKFAGADLRNTEILGGDLLEVNLRRADLRKANLKRANLRSADLKGVDLREADLQKADLRKGDLQEADLREADLRKADLQQANLQNANLQHADIQEAGLQKTGLQEADLRNAGLHDVDLRGTDLRGADLRDADLRGANLRGVQYENTSLSGVDLDASTRMSGGLRDRIIAQDPHMEEGEYEEFN
jgi:uncharacterized protein YjbI with pentapeptide repeats